MSFYRSLVHRVVDSEDFSFERGLRSLNFMGVPTSSGGSYTASWSEDQEQDSSVWSLVVDVDDSAVVVSVEREPAGGGSGRVVLGAWRGTPSSVVLGCISRAQTYLRKFVSHGDYAVFYDLLDSAFAVMTEVRSLSYRPLQLSEATVGRHVYLLLPSVSQGGDRILPGIIRRGVDSAGAVVVSFPGRGEESVPYQGLYVTFGG